MSDVRFENFHTTLLSQNNLTSTRTCKKSFLIFEKLMPYARNNPLLGQISKPAEFAAHFCSKKQEDGDIKRRIIDYIEQLQAEWETYEEDLNIFKTKSIQLSSLQEDDYTKCVLFYGNTEENFSRINKFSFRKLTKFHRKIAALKNFSSKIKCQKNSGFLYASIEMGLFYYLSPVYKEIDWHQNNLRLVKDQIEASLSSDQKDTDHKKTSTEIY